MSVLQTQLCEHFNTLNNVGCCWGKVFSCLVVLMMGCVAPGINFKMQCNFPGSSSLPRRCQEHVSINNDHQIIIGICGCLLLK